MASSSAPSASIVVNPAPRGCRKRTAGVVQELFSRPAAAAAATVDEAETSNVPTHTVIAAQGNNQNKLSRAKRQRPNSAVEDVEYAERRPPRNQSCNSTEKKRRRVVTPSKTDLTETSSDIAKKEEEEEESMVIETKEESATNASCMPITSRRRLTRSCSMKSTKPSIIRAKLAKPSTSVRRALFATAQQHAAKTKSQANKLGQDEETNEPQAVGVAAQEPKAKMRLCFGRMIMSAETVVSPQVKQVYAIVKRLTGSIGGNGSHGPIYGELKIGSMQKVINLMKQHCQFDHTSRFIDVGSGIGKPNLHVAHDPGVEFSYGIEVEADRWLLGMNCLRRILEHATKDDTDGCGMGHRVLFEHGDIREARSFDPFTHVYMFSIGFPPSLWMKLSRMWNRSQSPFLICYHHPKDIINRYEFHVELITKSPTSMHGSSEVHSAYLYKRCPPPPAPAAALAQQKGDTSRSEESDSDSSSSSSSSSVTDEQQNDDGSDNDSTAMSTACDARFVAPWALVQSGLEKLSAHVEESLRRHLDNNIGGLSSSPPNDA